VTVTVLDLASFGNAIQIETLLIMSHYTKKPSEAESLSFFGAFLQQCFANVKKHFKNNN
jgi:hypothetical protein